MSEVKKTKVHLISGFLGTGKTTALKSLMEQKDPNEKWVIIVNEFGEIGIDGAVLSDNGIPVAEIAGGCLCCTAAELKLLTGRCCGDTGCWHIRNMNNIIDANTAITKDCGIHKL